MYHQRFAQTGPGFRPAAAMPFIFGRKKRMLHRPVSWHVTFFIWLFGLFCALSVGSSESFSQQNTSTPRNPGEAPSMAISETMFDFGQVDDGSEVSHDYIVGTKEKQSCG
jgi:hypothetical protein